VDLDVRHLRLVVAIAEHRSLTRASEVLHLTQSALSHQLRDIEERLGTRLFLRLNKRMALTPAGDRVLTTARTVLEELSGTEAAIRGGLKEAVVPLRLSTECYTCYHWLPAVLKPYRERFPNVEIRIDAGSTRRPLPPLLEGKLDLAIMSSTIRDPRVAVRPVFEDEQVAVVARDHPFARLPYVRLVDFRKERLFTYVEREDSHFVTRVLEPAGVVPRLIEPVQITEAIIEMTRAGLGVAVLARWAVAPYLADGSLRAVRVTPEGLRREWKAVMPKALEQADYIDAFIRLVVEHTPSERARAVIPFSGRRRSRASG
jgi:LysR family transcriptional regulator, regulator for metE and metH